LLFIIAIVHCVRFYQNNNS